ncbi:MAG: cell division protein FtsA [Verrucomicrobiae bacterium]|nr:cell division protein FtsA [Verrucomicrobiae bacterium]
MSLVNAILKRNRSDFLVGLDIGTSSIKLAIGETCPDGSLSMVGSHVVESQGISKGEVQNQERACEAIARAFTETENNLGIGIEVVELAITGSHIASGTYTGHANVQSEEGEVAEADVRAAMDSASSCAQLGGDRAMIHTMRCTFELDGGPPLTNPVGHIGGTLKAEVHCIHGQATRIQNLSHCLCEKIGANVEIGNSVFSGFASALAVLEPEDKLGAIVIDLGGGITEYAVYLRGMLRQSGTLGVGGGHLVNDLMVGLGIRQRRRAEKLLQKAGGVMVEPGDRDKEVSFASQEFLGDREKVYYLEDIQRILHARMHETLRILRDRIFARNANDLNGATVFLTGGCSHLKGMTTLAQSVFDMHAKQGIPGGFEGQEEHLRKPEMATAVGLVKYAHVQRQYESKRAGPWWNRMWRAVSG